MTTSETYREIHKESCCVRRLCTQVLLCTDCTTSWPCLCKLPKEVKRRRQAHVSLGKVPCDCSPYLQERLKTLHQLFASILTDLKTCCLDGNLQQT